MAYRRMKILRWMNGYQKPEWTAFKIPIACRQDKLDPSDKILIIRFKLSWLKVALPNLKLMGKRVNFHL